MNKRGSVKSAVVTFILVLLILVMAGLLVYMLYGERIMPRFEFDGKGFSFVGADGGGYTDEESGGDNLNASENPENDNLNPDANPDDNLNADLNPDENSDNPDLNANGENNGENQNQSENAEIPVQEQPREIPVNEDNNAPDYNQTNNLPLALSVSPFDFTVRRLGEVTRLTAAGNPEVVRYSWVSQNPAIASVDQNGNVTANSNGITKILATDGKSKGECVVRVYSGSGNDGSSENQLNRTDFTRYVSEGGYQLSVSGLDAGSLTWRSVNPNIATVSATGFVTPVSPGTATIIVSWGDQSRVCTVRVLGE